MRTKRSEKGFTLVEIAIVLVIIGLLLGALLKGQEMINSAKIKRVVSEANELRAAALTYQDLYKYLPGDDLFPLTGVAGNGNGQIAGAEIGQFFVHLQGRNLISGSYAGTNYPTHAFGGNVSVAWATVQVKTTHWIQFGNMPGDKAQIIDTTYDDGNYQTGSIRGSGVYTGAAVTLSTEF